MKRAVIECSRIETLPQLHRALAQALDFPDYYGANLDASADCLGDLCGDTVLTLRDVSLLRERLGEDAGRVLEVLGQCAADSGRLMLLMTESAGSAAGKGVLQ